MKREPIATGAGRSLHSVHGHLNDEWAGLCEAGTSEAEPCELRDAILAIETEAHAAGRAEALGELDTLPWAEMLHDLEATQHYITHETSNDGDDMEGVSCITGAEGHTEDAADLLRDVLAALSDTTETKGDGA